MGKANGDDEDEKLVLQVVVVVVVVVTMTKLLLTSTLLHTFIRHFMTEDVSISTIERAIESPSGTILGKGTGQRPLIHCKCRGISSRDGIMAHVLLLLC